MKILVVQDHLRSGGTERQTVLLANGFNTPPHQAALLTFRPGGALSSSLPTDLRWSVLQPLDTRLDFWAPGITRRARAEAPDIVLCMGRMANCYGGYLQRRLPRAAVVATMRTGKPLPGFFRRSLHQVRHVVANSHDAQAVLRQREGVPAERISVIHNSLVFPPSPTAAERHTALRAQLGAGPATVVLACVAMFRPEKNQRALLEIVQRLPATADWQLWFAGDGPARAECEALARSARLQERVRFLGWSADPTRVYRAADVAVLTSRRESLSNFLIEAQAHGLPAVAYDARGVTEALLPGRTGFVVPMDDATGFASQLQRLINDADLRLSLAQAASTHARTAFAPERQLQAYLDLFSQLRPSFQP